MKTQTFRLDRMTCNHCVMSVRKSLAQIENLEVDDVQIGAAVVSFDENAVKTEDIEMVLAKAGYPVIGHE
ncbi:MAG: heavy-metal-associated domain-containing protein [Bacteroidota bacterium]